MDDAVKVFQLEKTDVTVMVLDGFLLEFAAVIGGQPERFVIAGVLAAEPFQQLLEVFEKGFVAEGPFAIRPPFGVHLQQSQVHPKLDFVLAVLAAELSDDNLARLIIPLIQQGGDVITHTTNMDANSLQVNARMQGVFIPSYSRSSSNSLLRSRIRG